MKWRSLLLIDDAGNSLKAKRDELIGTKHQREQRKFNVFKKCVVHFLVNTITKNRVLKASILLLLCRSLKAYLFLPFHIECVIRNLKRLLVTV